MSVAGVLDVDWTLAACWSLGNMERPPGRNLTQRRRPCQAAEFANDTRTIGGHPGSPLSTRACPPETIRTDQKAVMGGP